MGGPFLFYNPTIVRSFEQRGHFVSVKVLLNNWFWKRLQHTVVIEAPKW